MFISTVYLFVFMQKFEHMGSYGEGGRAGLPLIGRLVIQTLALPVSGQHTDLPNSEKIDVMRGSAAVFGFVASYYSLFFHNITF